MGFIREVRPHQATFVPDSEDQFTSDHGWDLARDADRLRPLIDECHALGVRVSLFMDPLPEAMAAVRALGADRIELYTETYASAHGTPRQAEVLAQFTRTAEAALALGLGINAGHDLSLANLTDFIRAVPGVDEVSIGHALVADALEFGMADTVHRYLRAIVDAESRGVARVIYRHRHRPVRRAPHHGHAGAQGRPLRREGAGPRRAEGVPRAARQGGEPRHPLPGDALLGQGGVLQGRRAWACTCR